MATSKNIPQVTPEQKEELKKWMKESKSLSILVTGKTGVGKSSLVNGIVGKLVAQEGSTLRRETEHVKEYSCKIKGVDVTIFDSPGLQDITSSEEDYLTDIASKCGKVDLILFCCKMNDERLSNDDVRTMKKLTQAFEKTLWENAIFILTFANKVTPTIRGREPSKTEIDHHFHTKKVQWKKVLTEILIDAGVDKTIADSIPAVPVGYHDNPEISDTKNWFSRMWKVCLERMANVAKPAFLKMNIERFRKEVSEEELRFELYKQPIQFPKGEELVKMNIPPALLDLFGLPAEMGLGGIVGEMAGGFIADIFGLGSTACGFNAVAFALLGELVLNYGMKYFGW